MIEGKDKGEKLCRGTVTSLTRRGEGTCDRAGVSDGPLPAPKEERLRHLELIAHNWVASLPANSAVFCSVACPKRV